MTRSARSNGPNFDGDSLLDRCGPEIAALYRLWLEKRGSKALPRRSEVGFEVLRPWLGRIGILDVLPGALPDGSDFVHRLVGTTIEQQLGVRLTGERISANVLSGSPETALANLREVSRSRLPRYKNSEVRCADGTSLTGERIWLPFGENGETTDSIVFFIAGFHVPDGADRADTRMSLI